MPKFGSHILFAEIAAAKRPDLFPSLHPNALRFGAVGPDTTLFLLDAAQADPKFRRGFDTALGVLETMQDIKDSLTAIKDKLTEPVETLGDYLSGGLTTDLSYTVEAATEALLLSAKLGIAFGAGSITLKNPMFDKLRDLPADFLKDPEHAAEFWTIRATDAFGFPFRTLGHPYTCDGWRRPEPVGDYSKWWWMDLLHYRKTGQFARQLLQDARGSLQESYARGYMTHVAGDICGHPFINSLVGGPFRNHAYRHLVLETLADTWLWHDQGRGDILNAGLQRQIDLSDSESRQIADLLIGAMKAVYPSHMLPTLFKNRFPDRDELMSAFRLLKQYLRLSTGGSIPRPTPPPESFSEVWEEIKDLLQAASPGRPPAWNGNIVDFLVALFAWSAKGFVLLLMIATLPTAILTRLLTVAPRWVFYLLNLALFYLISAIRTMLCLTGWGYAGIEDFASFGFLENMVTTPAGGWETYPFASAEKTPPFFWLASPQLTSPSEANRTVPLVPIGRTLRPSWMLNPRNSLDAGVHGLLVDLDAAATPVETANLVQQLQATNGFGNAVDFSIALLDGTLPVPDLDLDGDRGYGYRGWEEQPPKERYV